MSRITVITPSIPGREALLAEAIASVHTQTVPPLAHLIRVQRPPHGLTPLHIAHQRNALVRAVTSEWIATLDDDDVWLPHHLATLEPHLNNADVVYAFGENAVTTDVTSWSSQQLVAQLREANCVTSDALIRRDALAAVGGFVENPGDWDHERGTYAGTPCTWEDWRLWLAMADAGCRFVCVPQITWRYRSGDWAKCTG